MTAITVGCILLGCAAPTAGGDGAQSAATEESKPAPAAATGAGHDMDVEMSMEEQESEPAPVERGVEPPPTRTYSPANKLPADAKQ
jgi:hypothetical protein